MHARPRHSMHRSLVMAFFLAPLLMTTATFAQDPFIGEIRMFAGTFAPTGWAFCNGQLLPINQNTALFSLLGTTYGGDGRTTFALPDLRGRGPIHAGQGPGLSNRQLGESGGEERHTLIASEMPAHTHPLYADSSVGSFTDPSGRLPSRNAAGIPQYGSQANAIFSPQTVGPIGSSQGHNTMSPYLVVNYIIALQGIYPSRP